MKTLHLLNSKTLYCLKCGILVNDRYTMSEDVWNKVPYKCEKVEKEPS